MGASGAPALPTLLVSSGEPAGIGPDLCALLCQRPARARRVLVGDPDLLVGRARELGLSLHLRPWDPGGPAAPTPAGTAEVLDTPLRAPVRPGHTDPANAPYVLEMLERSARRCLAGDAHGLVTAPVHKGVINDAGIPFSGHTEFLAGICGTPRVVMMLAAPGMRVALATTHLPLRAVADAITRPGLRATVEILVRDLRTRFGIPDPRILVLGLNPHAGEGGHLGREEIEIIGPVLESLRAAGVRVHGPLPADTAFLPEHLEAHDAVLAMYHDQGLPVLKHAAFGAAVNITLGLPILRTSVDHGTALALAASGRARVDSLQAAWDQALEMLRHQEDHAAGA